MTDAQPSARIAIFRTGSHTAMSGLTRDYTAGELAACAAAYDPARFEAPVVVGHPDTNTPAFGWVKGLALEGDTLWAEAGQLDPAFVEAVQAGRYKKISSCRCWTATSRRRTRISTTSSATRGSRRRRRWSMG